VSSLSLTLGGDQFQGLKAGLLRQEGSLGGRPPGRDCAKGRTTASQPGPRPRPELGFRARIVHGQPPICTNRGRPAWRHRVLDTPSQSELRGRLRRRPPVSSPRRSAPLAARSPRWTWLSRVTTRSSSTVPDEWLKDSTDHPAAGGRTGTTGSTSGPASKPGAKALVGSDTYPPLAAAPGEYVRRRLS
jgi:hypothetical protein